ncbi:metabolite traffic protein EboE [Streptomyces sp. NBC_00887]|uniref:metabolite traffic protein EboE n=1 Tax=Streptomyces sp. NBC_00887 TaxID=2975859 RepID=UPI00386DE461|nr:metabolite traffic protein EboE [Streptomyces sp. NBC_00887]WSY36288.1 metabolite traffic protein EboE [Streptomyces sp. NBC_00887]
MRFRHPDGSTVHLAYCTNVHPAETLDGVLAQLRDHCEPVRIRLGWERLGIGLWLARDAVFSLVRDPGALRLLRAELRRRRLEVVTLNGVPYEGFGAEKVKFRVYKPDWADPQRLKYTADLARLLTALLPDDVSEGSISTLPLAWRTSYSHRSGEAARRALSSLVDYLDAMERSTGRSIRVGLEPEPGCILETTADATALLSDFDPFRIGVCVDTGHLATSFEDPATALGELDAANIPVVKAQLSTALHVQEPHMPEARQALAAFDEPRFLHQTRVRTEAGLRGTDDVGEALGLGGLPVTAPWRAHFRLPLHAVSAGPLTSTLPVLKECLAHLVGGPAARTHQLEVETYMWQALPPSLRPLDRAGLIEGIAAELAFAHDLLTDLGLKELP